MARGTDPATTVYLIDLKNGWLNGCDLAAAGKACDGIVLCAYDMAPDAVTALMQAGRAAIGADKFLAAGFRLFFPEMQSATAFADRAGAARAAGCDGLNFYNYGLVPQARLGWVKQATTG